MVSTKQNPNPQQTKPIPTASKPRPTASKPTTNQQWANDEQNTCKRRANRKPPTQIATTETQIANRKSPTQLPPKSASHHHWNPNRYPLTKILTHYTQITRPTDPQPLQSTAKKSRERAQERIKKKEEWEKMIFWVVSWWLMTDVLGFNLIQWV